MHARTIGLAILGAALWLRDSPALAAPPVLASHRAVYDISLLEAQEGTDVTSVKGRLVLEFTGSECAGYTSKLRFVTEMQDSDGGRQMTDSRSSTFETADGRTLDFNNETYAGDVLAEESEGKASKTGDDVSIALTRPGKKKIVIRDSVLFPTEQMERLLASAMRGEAFVSFEVYDGSENGETVFDTAGVIGKVSTSANDAADEPVVLNAGIAGMRHWPVTISYFDERGGGEETPFYVLSFVVYENGIGRDMRIDYGEFSLSGKLTGLELLPPPPCPGADEQGLSKNH
ncbi:MAG TPA: cell envelope integrity EipB family protein [Bauldia sp.]|nr:cell envelope integrity EipB family protein [Bauldia sp.]